MLHKTDLFSLIWHWHAQRMPKTINYKKAEVCIDKEVTVRV